jgi:hypothetical protein
MIRAHKALSIKSPTPDARQRRPERVMSASGSDVARTSPVPLIVCERQAPSQVFPIRNT